MAALYPAWLRCELDRDKVNLVDGWEDELIVLVDCSTDETFQAITPSCNPGYTSLWADKDSKQ